MLETLKCKMLFFSPLLKFILFIFNYLLKNSFINGCKMKSMFHTIFTSNIYITIKSVLLFVKNKLVFMGISSVCFKMTKLALLLTFINNDPIIFSIFIWNIVIYSLLVYKDRILVCDNGSVF